VSLLFGDLSSTINLRLAKLKLAAQARALIVSCTTSAFNLFKIFTFFSESSPR
jgi:hypothetical protein